MKKYVKFLFLGIGLAALAGAALYWWPAPPAQAPSATAATSSSAPEPQLAAAGASSAAQIQHPIEAIAVAPTPSAEPAPTAASAERYLRQVLADMFTSADIARFLQLGNFVHHLVATVDNLPREQASAVMWPVNPMPGHFSTGAGDDSNPIGPTAINPKNNERYNAFVTFVESVDTTKAVALYVRLYPLFQQAYVELGYPKGHFNDRLVAVIDHLLTTPLMVGSLQVVRVEVKGPYPALRPWVNYQFVDPALAHLSAGQKMLLRAGSANQQRLQNKLRSFRALLARTSVNQVSAATSSPQR